MPAAFPDAASDCGLFFVYLMNLVALKPGQGTYQPAGVLHAYLEGSNIELMANSDNVLRAGLTSKHIDPAELLRTLSFETGFPPILKGQAAGPGARVYRTPSTEFELTRLQVPAGARRRRDARGPVILLIVEGEATIGGIALHKGQAVFARDEQYVIETAAAPVVAFEAAIPGN